MNVITLQELAKELAEKKNLEYVVARTFISTMFEVIRAAIDRDKLVKVKGLGTFKLIEVGARESINVNNGERVIIGSHGKISFTPDSIMKEIVNKPFSQFETVVLNDGVDFDDITDGSVESISDEKNEDELTQENISQLTPTLDSCVENKAARDDSGDDIVKDESCALDGENPNNANKENVASDEVAIDVEVTENVNKDGEAINIAADEGDVSSLSDKIDRDEGLLDAAHKDSLTDQSETISETAKTNSSTPIDVYNGVNPKNNNIEGNNKENSKNYSYAKIVWIYIIALVALVGSAYCGFLFGLHISNKSVEAYRIDRSENIMPKMRDKVNKSVPVSDSISNSLQSRDSLHNKADNGMLHAKGKLEKTGEGISSQISSGADEHNDFSQYELKDPRVLTGAYKIIGTDRVVVVKSGETLKSISNRILGVGMECYVEVYNDLKSDTKLKEGQKLKIPKLELKKKRRK